MQFSCIVDDSPVQLIFGRVILQMFQRLSREDLQGSMKAQMKEEYSLDSEYLAIRAQILDSPFMAVASKHVQIRLEGWVGKLDEVTANALWKRNRNNYAKLINLVCECEIVVDPFLALPPHHDLPKLTRHAINSVIDAVEREVKHENRQSRQSYSSKDGDGDQLSKSKDCLYQQGISNAREEEESSFLSDRFANTDELNYDSITFDAKNGMFFSAAQSVKSPNSSTKVYLSEAKNKQNIKTPNDHQNNGFSKDCSYNYPLPKHIIVKLNSPTLQTGITQSSAKKSNKSQKIQSESYFSSSSIGSAYQSSIHNNSNENYIQNDTLNTELIDQDSVQTQNLNEECDFSGELSERCRDKEQILNHSYFTWKAGETCEHFRKQPIKFTKAIPSKLLQSRQSPINASIQSMDHQNIEDSARNLSASLSGEFLKDITENINNLTE